MSRRFYHLLLIIIIVIAAYFGYRFYRQYKTKDAQDHARVANILHFHKQQAANHSNGETKIDSSRQKRLPVTFTKKEWLLMGYLAYAKGNYERSQGVKNNQQLVKAVKKDLQSSSLKCKEEDAHTYILSNKFGSVNGYVKSNQVKITGDGITITSFATLRRTYGPYDNELKEMSLMIR